MAQLRRTARVRSAQRQRGQALIYGMFLLVGSLAALFFLFNTGQLSKEKTKLVNTADAVAYSAGIMHARALNFDAYTNRAMMANTIAIGQLVSVSSWIKYIDIMGTFGATTLFHPKYAHYYVGYFAAEYAGPYLDNWLVESDVLDGFAQLSDGIIQRLKLAQSTMAATLVASRLVVMNDVADKNYEKDTYGNVNVDVTPLSTQTFNGFIQRYEDDDRTRFKEVILTSMRNDEFVWKRSWKLPALFNDCMTAYFLGRIDWLERAGGTELIGFDEWKAVDAMSEFKWVPKSKTDAECRALAETQVGWGGQTASDDPSAGANPGYYDMALIKAPGSAILGLAEANSEEWDYSGLPSFYDLSEDGLDADDPKLEFAVRLSRDISETVTSEGRSSIGTTPRLNDYRANAPRDQLAAVATSEVYFDRPVAHPDNHYGNSISRPRELASLFNPFWQVRLIHSQNAVRAAQLLQGAVMP